jgi:ribosomal protein S12 methylthiotransferase accessory factor
MALPLHKSPNNKRITMPKPDRTTARGTRDARSRTASRAARSPRVALARSARIAPVDGGLIAETAEGTVVFDCGLSVDQTEHLLALLDTEPTHAEIATALALPRSSVRDLLRELDGAGLLAERRKPQPRVRRDDDVLLAGLGELGAAVLGQLLATTTARVWLYDPAAGAARGCIAAATDTLPAAARGRLGVLPAALDVDALAPVARRARIAVCCVDQPGVLLDRIAELAAAAGMTLVPVQATAEGIQIGPISSGPHRHALDGCAACGELFRRSIDQFSQAVADYVARHNVARVRWGYPPDPASRAAAAALVVAWLRRLADRPAPGRALLIGAGGDTVTERRVVQHPACRLAPAPEVPAGDARTAARAFADQIRCSDPPLELRALAARLDAIGAPAGLGPVFPTQPLSPAQRDELRRFIAGRGVAPDASLLAHAHQAKTYLPRLGDVAVGVDFLSAEVAGALSMIEGLERLSCFSPLTPIPTAHHSFTEVAGRAIDPASLPLYAPHQYAQPGFAPRPYHPDRPIHWLWGVDVGAGEPVLVPADVVRPGQPGELIALCTSNGAACHSSFTHAILNGLYEVIERDAFSIAWMNRLSLPRTGLSVDPLGIFAEWRELGFTFAAVDATTDLDVPVLLLTCRDLEDPDRFIATFSSGRSLPQIASRLQKELLQFALLAIGGASRGGAALADHFLWYQDRTRAPLVEFLTASHERSRFDAHPHFAAAAEETPGEELARLVAQLDAHGHRVVVVDLTTPWLRSLGLCAVRVVVPGLQPIHFGRGNRALGGSRLYQAPRRMGRRDRDTTIEELYPWEHPFA